MSLDIDLVAYVDLGGPEPVRFEVYSRNITHNLTPMWDLAGCYEALYESNGQKAQDILPILEAASKDMEANPAKYIILNPPNKWGSYDSACTFLGELIWKCREYPLAIVEISK